jgi:hypothetical protein
MINRITAPPSIGNSSPGGGGGRGEGGSAAHKRDESKKRDAVNKNLFLKVFIISKNSKLMH